MQVLVTGAAGFIASNFVHFLVAKRPSWAITALDNLGYAGNFENISSLVSAGKVEFAKVDIADAAAVGALFKSHKFELVFNLAAESHVDRSILSGAEFVRSNVLGTQILLDASRAAKVSRYVQISTDEVYGSLGPTGRFVESTPLDPSSAYSASKASGDLMALAAHKTHGMPVMVTRCTNNYGPYQFPEKLIPLFVTNALENRELPLYGDGMNVRSWLHVSDHCEALLLVGEKGRPGEVYNVGGAEESELPNKLVTEKILTLLGKPVTLVKKVADRPGHDRRYAIDYGKIKAELGWSPKVAFDRGLAETVAWYRDHENWWRDIKNGSYRDFYQKNYGSRGVVK